jgi:DNA repair protein RadA/Sms
MYLVTETKLQAILNHVEKLQPALVIVDSIQTTFAEDLTSAAGSVSQVRECASRFQELAKNNRRRHLFGGARYQRGDDCRATGAGAHR